MESLVRRGRGVGVTVNLYGSGVPEMDSPMGVLQTSMVEMALMFACSSVVLLNTDPAIKELTSGFSLSGVSSYFRVGYISSAQARSLFHLTSVQQFMHDN